MTQDFQITIQSFTMLLITSFIIPWLKCKIGEQKYNRIKKHVSTAVIAAEKLHGAKTGGIKKEYVEIYLEALGIKLKPQELSAEINCAISEYIDKGDFIYGEINENTDVCSNCQQPKHS
jgi:hypothetical protein